MLHLMRHYHNYEYQKHKRELVMYAVILCIIVCVQFPIDYVNGLEVDMFNQCY